MDTTEAPTYGPTRTRVRALVFEEGYTQYKTAHLLGISKQRVSQHVAAIVKLEPELRKEVVS